MAPERPGPEGEPADDNVSIPVTLLSIGLPNGLLHIKEGDRASEGNMEKVSEDDDLTSLTWLQDKNLLKGINLRTNVTGAQESPTSDFVDDSTSERESSCSSSHSSPTPPPTPANVPAIKNKHPHHIPYDPQVHTTSKPPYSFSCLIFMAIDDAPNKALPVKEIYNWILDHFPFYKNAPTGWKNSVRHNLSLNKCFRKVDKAPNLGKGSLWMVDPLYRSNLLQALQKAPYHPCQSNDKPNSPPPNPPTIRTVKMPSRMSNGGRLPDPELFPYLARRLAAVDGCDPLEDVHAAAVMLQLKHGANLPEEYRRSHLIQVSRGPKKKGILSEVDSMMITSSPSEDHTYSSAEPSATQLAEPKTEPTSPDEAFADGSDSNSSWHVPVKVEVADCSDIEEQRKIAEGADALLNLAGITTQHTPPATPLKHQNATPTPFRPRLLRKAPLEKRRAIPEPPPQENLVRNRWKPAIVTENNNVVVPEQKHHEYRPPAKIRRKSSGFAKTLGKSKR